MNNASYEVELVKAQIEHKEPITCWFFTLQYAKLWMLELYYKFFTKFCHVDKFEELEMDTDCLNLAPSEKEMEDCIRPEMKWDWEQLRSKDCNDCLIADANGKISPGMCSDKHKKHDKREPDLFKAELGQCWLCCESYCCYDTNPNKSS